jgi:hypothetical protein
MLGERMKLERLLFEGEAELTVGGPRGINTPRS